MILIAETRNYTTFWYTLNMDYRKIYICGHRNPDVDSLMSACALADLRKKGTLEILGSGLVLAIPVSGPELIVVLHIERKASGKVFHVVAAFACHGTIPCLLQCRQQHGGKNGDDGNYDKQFDQGKEF